MCVLQVTLAYESIVLYMCEGKVLMDNKITLMYKIIIDNTIYGTIIE